MSPVDWPDEQRRAEPHATLAQTASAASVPASPNTLDVQIGTLAAYRSVRVNVHTGTFPVEVTCFWTMEGSASGLLMDETKTYDAASYHSELFRSQGHVLDSVSFASVGGASTIDYDIAGSNLDPLPAETPAAVDEFGYPTLYTIPLFSWPGGEDVFHFSAVVIDAACVNNARRTADGTQSAYFVTHLRLGPKGSIWSLSARHTEGPDHGTLAIQWGTPTEDAPASDGFVDPTGLMQGSDGDGLTYIPFPDAALNGSFPGYAAAGAKDVLTTSRSEFRIMGESGAVLSAFSAPTDPNATWFRDADGGPGLWNLKLILDTKDAASTSYKYGLSELRVQRIDWLGF